MPDHVKAQANRVAKSVASLVDEIQNWERTIFRRGLKLQLVQESSLRFSDEASKATGLLLL